MRLERVLFVINIYVLDLLGTFAFAVYGANIGLNRQLNALGISVSAFLTAVGRGTVRCLLTHTTPSYFLDNHYIIAIVSGIVFALVTYHFFKYIHFPMLLIDAVGLVTFAYIGAYKAESYHFGLFGVVFFAGLTAAGGGVLRDALVGKIPDVFLDSSYATPAILLGTAYWLLLPYMAQTLSVYGLLLFFFLVRTIAIKWNITLWLPFGKMRNTDFSD
jgi:uncharacterized membrane protein YeiH